MNLLEATYGLPEILPTDYPKLPETAGRVPKFARKSPKVTVGYPNLPELTDELRIFDSQRQLCRQAPELTRSNLWVTRNLPDLVDGLPKVTQN